ncbi:MAG: DivIVA domain-containing protein [Clostridia bacterium]|nr:DivIVA domain-containing protein [Clostridia bacterium]
MLTVEDISNVEFTKTLGGYKTSEVDHFLDQCADTVSALNKEITALNKKLEVLADKVVEYREKLDAYQKEEDSIKTALVTAQRMGDNVVRDATKKAELLLQDAEIKAQNIKDNAARQVESENDDLRRIRQQVSDFKAQLMSLYKAHLEQIQLLPEVPKEEQQPAPQPEEEQPAAEVPAEPEQPVPQPAEPEEKDVKVYQDISSSVPTAPLTIPVEPVQVVPPLMAEPEPENNPTVKNRFSDIRFGTEYDIHMEAEEERKGFFKRKK